jgi:hypothetical protein
MKRPRKMRTPDHTRLKLSQEKNYRPFIDGYSKVLQSNLKYVKHIGNNYQYRIYTCGEPHDRQNPNWKPFRLLWDYCERTGYDFYVVRDIIFERIGRKLVCECEMLQDNEKRRHMELERIFGVDFGGPGGRGLELV